MTNREPEETQPFHINQPEDNPDRSELVGKADSEGNINETIPVITENTIQVSANTDRLPGGPKKAKKKRWPIIVGGILMILILAAAGGWMGYNTGINLRIQQEESNVAMVAATQFALAEQDILTGKLATAQRRLEYVIQVDPNFPGAAEMLSNVMVEQAIKNKPTEVPTPTLSPTPDLRGEEDMFAQIEQHLRASEWDSAIASVEAIRVKNPDYRVVDVDGLYYIALRNRGINKILNEGSLELGVYDLALAAEFGPIDKDADNYRNWARLYMSGASFWEVDWAKVLDYFSQIYLSLPNLHDSSGFTAVERYRQAAIGYADQLALSEDWCGARDYYSYAFQISGDPNVGPTATWVAYECNPPTKVPEPTEVKPTKEKTSEGEPTQEETQEPVDTEEPPPAETPVP